VNGLSPQQLEDLEGALGQALPPDVKAAYAQENGKIGPTNIWLLLPHEETANGIVAHNLDMRKTDWLPDLIQGALHLGTNGCGGYISWLPDEQKAVLWYPADGEIAEQAQTVSELWMTIVEVFESEAS
jgi:hypothetical protein